MLLMRSWGFGITAVLIWCAIPIAVKSGARGLDWSWILLLRFLISSLLMLPVLVPATHRLRKIGFPTLLRGAGFLGVNYALQTWAMLHLSVSIYSLVFSLSPILVLGMTGARWNLNLLLGSIISIAGVAVSLDWNSVGDSFPILPLLSLLGGMLGWVAVNRWMLRAIPVLTSAQSTATLQALSLLGVLPVWIGRGLPIGTPGLAEAQSILWLGAGVPIAFWFYDRALRSNAVIGVASQYLEPLVGCALGVAVLSEPWSQTQTLACTMILAGLALFSRGAPKTIREAAA